jgi:hypothetical protein
MLTAAQSSTTDGAPAESGRGLQVRHLRQVLLWPLRLLPVEGVEGSGGGRVPPWQVLRDLGSSSPWREVVDEFTGDSEAFHERHYNEFVSFLPYVQRFLYGEGRKRAAQDDALSGSPMRVFRRSDIARARVIVKAGDAPLLLDVVHLDLYFFYDVDVVILNVELRGDEL